MRRRAETLVIDFTAGGAIGDEVTWSFGRETSLINRSSEDISMDFGMIGTAAKKAFNAAANAAIKAGVEMPSTEWQICTAIGGGAGALITVNALLLYLHNVRSRIYYPGRFLSVGLGAGIGIRGASLGEPSWTTFSTVRPMMTEDFAGYARIASWEATIGEGVSGAVITFIGKQHNPYWIDISSKTAGLSIGVGVTVVGSVHFWNDPRPWMDGRV